jgi:hypothetical protein
MLTFSEAYAITRAYSMVPEVYHRSLWDEVCQLDVEGIPGALVECGCWKGGCVGTMALAHISGGNPWRGVHLFDSFEGLPEPGEQDGDKAKAHVGLCKADLADARTLFRSRVGYPEDLVIYHVGWFENTVPTSDTGPIALLRLDGDWYESTKVCLEHLYQRIAPGGYLVIDDYMAWERCKRAVDEFFQSRERPEAVQVDPCGCPYPLWVGRIREI